MGEGTFLLPQGSKPQEVNPPLIVDVSRDQIVDTGWCNDLDNTLLGAQILAVLAWLLVYVDDRIV